jgi:aspartyl-tRNA synthetase
LGNLRSELAQILNLIPKNAFKPVWITNFPLLEWNEEEQRYTATHHPFTSYVPEEENLLDREPEKVHARAYDIVINGAEIGGGSIRNNTTEKQMKVFKALGIDKNKAMWKFGFLLDALKFGAPPHGGIALGFDRLVAILSGVDNIREVIAFPKTTSAASLMDGSPSEIEEEQLKELGLRTIE